MYTIQQILNRVRIDENGQALSVLETEQQSFNAVFDSEQNALRVSGGSSGLTERIVHLEDTYVKSTYFEQINSGTAGTVAPPVTGASFVMDEWSAGVDAIVSAMDSGKPTLESPRDAGGNIITAAFNAAGEYSLSGTPVSYPVALIYVYRCKFKNHDDTKTIYESELELPDATTSNKGRVELATDAETITGIDPERAVTPANVTAKIDTDGTLAGNLDTRIPSQKAVKTYADTKASKDSFKPPAPVAFAGPSGRTITHNYGHTDYQIIVNPVADPGGYLGEIWYSKAANTVVVYNSGSATGNFDYTITPSS
jgi:hypothetical protein